MRALILNAETRKEIAEAVERARANPIVIDKAMQAAAADRDAAYVPLADRKPGPVRPPSEHVLIPQGYRASISFEIQPVGLCRHLSISLDSPGRIPTIPAVQMISEAFGFGAFPPALGKVWIEEFQPGHSAVNILELVTQHAAGNA